MESCVIIFLKFLGSFVLFVFFGTGNGEKLSPTDGGVSDRHVSFSSP